MKIAILGGGISGLSAAWSLVHQHPRSQIVLFEKSSRLGGCIETVDLFEKGPRTFRSSHCPSLLRLIEDLGLKDELLFSQSASSKRYLWHQGSLRSIFKLSAPYLLRMLFALFIPKGTQEETVYSFFRRRYGVGIADLFADPLCLGIYAGDCRTLSVNACFPSLKGIEKKRGRGSLFTLQRGMQSLIDALQQQLAIDIRLNSEVHSLKQLHQKWEINNLFVADHVVSALPFPVLARLFPSLIPLHHVSMIVANIGFSSFEFPHRGYGYLVPTRENQSLLGMIWDSAIFPQQAGTRLTAMMRAGTAFPEETILHALRSHLGISQQPDRIDIHHPETAIPQFTLGHAQRLQSWENALPGVALLGNYTDGVSVEKCISRSFKLKI